MLDDAATGLTTLWVGGLGGMEEDLVKRAGVSYQAIPAAGIHGVGWRKLPGNIRQLLRGYQASRRILQAYQPDVLLFTGGYLAVPMALAGQAFTTHKVPSVVIVPDIQPGQALKTLARLADRISVPVEDSRRYFGRRRSLEVTGYPVRPDLLGWSRAQALQVFNLDPHYAVLLVFGGSSGAQSINRALFKNLSELLGITQVIHITGQRNYAEVESAARDLSPKLRERYHAFAYLHEEMGAALCAADLVVSRAGASSLGEYPLFGLPAILVPYPHAWRYQQVNAEYLAGKGAALILPDAGLDERLVGTVQEILSNPEKLTVMRAAMQQLARPQAAQNIATLVAGLAAGDRSAL
jgi:UDP-N-acetylglucosamine--N-acetylmuramyl-(pentapeptide) pyrophosphoryl-undecaprenol N-acetylglucosamine transferase